jgi:hypothetical protein
VIHFQHFTGIFYRPSVDLSVDCLLKSVAFLLIFVGEDTDDLTVLMQTRLIVIQMMKLTLMAKNFKFAASCTDSTILQES